MGQRPKVFLPLYRKNAASHAVLGDGAGGEGSGERDRSLPCAQDEVVGGFVPLTGAEQTEVFLKGQAGAFHDLRVRRADVAQMPRLVVKPRHIRLSDRIADNKALFGTGSVDQFSLPAI